MCICWCVNLNKPQHERCIDKDDEDITGCISYKPLTVNVNTIAECLRVDYNILGDNKKKNLFVSVNVLSNLIHLVELMMF